MAYTTIDKPTDYFNTVLYSGTGSNNSITGVGFQPDWVWQKRRDSTGNHELTDSVRGINSTLVSNTTSAQDTGTDKLQSFDSDGFTAGSSSTNNASGGSFVAWNWLAGGTASSNTDGSITSTVSANTTAGFSIVSYTGTGSSGTLGHGLNAVPKMIILKQRSGTENWMVYHAGNTSAPETDYLLLNNTSATADFPVWNDTTPTSSVFSIGTDTSTSSSGATYIAYCFAEKKGYSKFGSYTGNGNADGTFVYTGFKPAWVMGKRTDTTNNWYIFDSVRDPYNLTQRYIRPDTNSAEIVNSSKAIDIYSNGFKIKNSDPEFNASGGTYIYMAFAENPFVTSSGIPTTAR